MTKLGPLTQVDIPFKYTPSEAEEQVSCHPSGLSTRTVWLPKTQSLVCICISLKSSQCTGVQLRGSAP